jgi:hypothetical protein
MLTGVPIVKSKNNHLKRKTKQNKTNQKTKQNKQAKKKKKNNSVQYYLTCFNASSQMVKILSTDKE